MGRPQHYKHKYVKEVEKAWAAGFFDGEGCTTITSCQPGKNATNKKRPHRGLRMSIAQVKVGPLLQFLDAVRLGTIRGPYKYGTNKQFHFQWNASGLDVIGVLDVLWPYLSTIKQIQALAKVEEYCTYLERYPPRVNQFDRRVHE